MKAYYGLVSFLDYQIGRVLQELDAQGLTESTRVLYTSDHGECLSARGLFGKFTHYEESGGIPLILAGPDIPEGLVCNTPVSLLDIHSTIYHGVGHTAPVHRHNTSLLDLANTPEQQRSIFGEYHAVNSKHGAYLLTDNRYKYIYHVHEPAQLFDLEHDPEEIHDLGQSDSHSAPKK